MHIAKFNNTVPGTLIDTYESNLTTEIYDSSTFSTNITYYVTTNAAVVGVAGGIVFLTFSFIIVCVLIGFSVRRKRKSHTLTTASTPQQHNGTQTQGIMCHNAYLHNLWSQICQWGKLEPYYHTMLYADCSNVEIKVNPSYGNLRQLQAQIGPIAFLNGAEGMNIFILKG